MKRYDAGSPMLNKDLDLKDLKDLRNRNAHKIIIGHLNINSVRNKFKTLQEKIEKNIDIFLISETKINGSFPTEQFILEGFQKPFRLDRTDRGGGLLFYVRHGIPSKLVKAEDSYEAIFVEVIINKQKWLISHSYNPDLKTAQEHFEKLQISLDLLPSKYKNLLMIGDLNCEIDNSEMPNFCDSLELKGLINLPTCYKNPDNPKCIDHILTNSPESFLSTAYTMTTGFSDFHKMTLAVMDKTFTKLPPTTIKYRCFRNFDKDSFSETLNNILQDDTKDFEAKNKSIVEELDKSAPFKFKKLRGNNAPFVNKELRKAIMERSKLKSSWLKDKQNDNKKTLYHRQRNYCLSLLRRTKKKYFADLKVNKVTDSRKFWKTVKPFFSNKSSKRMKYTLVENDNIVNEEKKVAEIFGDFYSNIISNLDLPVPPHLNTEHEEHVEKCIHKYREHQSVVEIKEKEFEKSFEFRHCSNEEVEKIIKELTTNKSQPSTDIPVKIIKEYSNQFSEFMTESINRSIDEGVFPDTLKVADITPVYKNKGSKSDKTNYRPISILPVLSKIYERVIHNQLSEYFENILSDNQCAYRKGFSTQPSLMTLVETWKKATDDKNKFGALLIDLSKAFDCICHDLLIAKLDAYGLKRDAINLIADYLSRRKQRVKVGDHYSAMNEIEDGVPQGSILGPLLFNIYTRDLFYLLHENKVLNYADDTTPYAVGNLWEEVANELGTAALKIFEWLEINQMIGNADKSQLISNSSDKENFISVLNEKIYNSECAKILGVKFDSTLNFEQHITKLCKEASNKISALARIAPFMDEAKRRTIMNAFFKCQFSYCPLVWMFHSRRLEHRINHLHERCLRIVYSDNQSSFEDLLDRDNAVTFHHRNLQLLAIELFKIVKGLPNQTENLFLQNKRSEEDIGTRHLPFFKSRDIRTVHNGEESLSFLAPKIWELVPIELKELGELNEFKELIKHWRPTSCPCRLCKIYIHGVGFI